MGKKIIKDSTLTSIANAIRAKAETTTTLSFPDGFISTLDGIPTGGSGDGYKIATGLFSFPTKTVGLPSIQFDFNLVGAIMMIQDTPSVSRSRDTVDTLYVFPNNPIAVFPGVLGSTSIYSILSLNTNNFLTINGNTLSWASNKTSSYKYLWGTYFYMVWGN